MTDRLSEQEIDDLDTALDDARIGGILLPGGIGVLLSGDVRDAALRAIRQLRGDVETATLRMMVQTKMLRYIAFVLTGDEDGDAQLGSDRISDERDALRAELSRVTAERDSLKADTVARERNAFLAGVMRGGLDVPSPNGYWAQKAATLYPGAPVDPPATYPLGDPEE